MTPDESCPFCEIVALEDPDAREIYRDEHCVAFFPTEPAVLGHSMVIPRTHVRDVWSVTPELGAQLSLTTLRIAAVMRDVLKPDGLNIIQSNGEAASQSVMHVHIHLVPRWSDDRVGRIWPPESNYSEAQKNLTWTRLREACRALTRDSMSTQGLPNQQSG